MKPPNLWVLVLVLAGVGVCTNAPDLGPDLQRDLQPKPGDLHPKLDDSNSGEEVEGNHNEDADAIREEIEPEEGHVIKNKVPGRKTKRISQEEYRKAIGIVKQQMREHGLTSVGTKVFELILRLYEEGYITLEQIEALCDWICAQYPCPPDCPGYYEPPWG